MERTTISKHYKYKPIVSHVGLEGRIPIKHKDVIVGVEIELEGIDSTYKINSHKVTEDGSLKLDGAEFVTIPIKMRYLEVELRRILDGIKNPITSSRCSTHVHMNVRDMTPKEIISFVLLYMIFERSLYRISGDRWNSNFCVPLTMAPQLVTKFLKYWDNTAYWAWNKYTGLNISPIWGGESSCIGTIEFRQLHGTTNVEEIIQWCNLITSLKRFAQDVDQDELISHIRTLNTTSGYGWITKEVFGRYAKLLTDQPTFVEDVEKCISIIKLVIPTSKLHPELKQEKEKKVIPKVKKKNIDIDDVLNEANQYQKQVLNSLANNWIISNIANMPIMDNINSTATTFNIPIKPEGEF